MGILFWIQYRIAQGLFCLFAFFWVLFLRKEEVKKLQIFLQSSTIRKAIGTFSATEVLKNEK